jgi:hypothetical protein
LACLDELAECCMAGERTDGLDELHVPVDDDSPWLTETAWYSFWTAEREFAGHVYLRFRPNLQVMDAFVYVWGPDGSVPWDTAYWKDLRLPMPDSLRDLRLPGGLQHVVVRPFEHYELAYRDDRPYGGAFGFELQVEAISEPTYFGTKHFDQAVRVTGHVEVEGATYQVDCLAMRDRSWYRRGDFTLFRSAYSYAIESPTDSFLGLFAAPRDSDMMIDDLPLVGGHSVSGADLSLLKVGSRRVVDRDPLTGQPREIALVLGDALGKEQRISGRVTHALALAANTSMLSWMSLVEWDVGGRVVVGEDQDIWSPSIWRAFRRGSRS